MTKFYLSIPFDLKDELKKEGIKWDMDGKTWYIEIDELPESLVKYESEYIAVEYDDKDLYKAKFKSMSWDGKRKLWRVSKEDSKKIEKYRE